MGRMGRLSFKLGLERVGGEISGSFQDELVGFALLLKQEA
jgi:hypothetical protein